MSTRLDFTTRWTSTTGLFYVVDIDHWTFLHSRHQPLHVSTNWSMVDTVDAVHVHFYWSFPHALIQTIKKLSLFRCQRFNGEPWFAHICHWLLGSPSRILSDWGTPLIIACQCSPIIISFLLLSPRPKPSTTTTTTTPSMSPTSPTKLSDSNSKEETSNTSKAGTYKTFYWE